MNNNYTVAFYTYSGAVIEEKQCTSLRKAKDYAKNNQNHLSCYSWAIYNDDWAIVDESK